MLEIKYAQQAIHEFLAKKIATTIEQKQKKSKDEFTEEDAQKIRNTYEVRTWINNVVENIDKLFLNVSHVAKLTHSSSQAMSLKDSIPQTQYLHLISTQTAGNQHLDSGYSDAKVAPIAEFLSYPVSNSSKQLGELLSEYEQCFALISDNKEERETWCNQIKQAYTSQKIRTHVLAKQIYIPVAESYHLVSPMYSSSLAQHIYLAIKEAHDKDNPARVARKHHQWCEHEAIYFPNIATLGVTKSNHQNVSKLNGERAGQMYLFSSLPPKIKHNPNPPKDFKQLKRRFFYPCKDNLSEIKALLYVVEDKDLFLDFSKRNILIEHIQSIMEKILDMMLMIRQQYTQGWSSEYSFPMSVRLFIDEEILNTQTFSQPEVTSYIGDLAVEFAQWINKKIDKSYQKDFEKMWCKIIIPMLQSHYQVLKAE